VALLVVKIMVYVVAPKGVAMLEIPVRPSTESLGAAKPEKIAMQFLAVPTLVSLNVVAITTFAVPLVRLAGETLLEMPHAMGRLGQAILSPRVRLHPPKGTRPSQVLA